MTIIAWSDRPTLSIIAGMSLCPAHVAWSAKGVQDIPHCYIDAARTYTCYMNKPNINRDQIDMQLLTASVAACDWSRHSSEKFRSRASATLQQLLVQGSGRDLALAYGTSFPNIWSIGQLMVANFNSFSKDYRPPRLQDLARKGCSRDCSCF
jgi:hypothetical protein